MLVPSDQTRSGDVIPALLPRGDGHQFVCYGDSCSGVTGALHERTFAAVNSVVQRLEPRPEFICFPGDEIQGLLADDAALRHQWRYWLEHEMAWLDRSQIPLYHTTGNHTTYDAASEAIFRETLSHLPRNGPPGQDGLSYFVRQDDLLLVFVNTLWSGLGGEGRVETEWLNQTLAANDDAPYKLVVGHHPAFPVNGFSGAYQRELAPENAREFWDVLLQHQVVAYLCSHILAFDVQVHRGILQITTAGAGTAHRMPEEFEYLHCVQLALDAAGLRYQVLDAEGQMREWLDWPIPLDQSSTWPRFVAGGADERFTPKRDAAHADLLVWGFTGITTDQPDGEPQTLVSGWDDGPGLSTVWIGLIGPEQRLAVLLSPEPGRSAHLWHGPTLAPDTPFSIQVAIHTGMGPGGLMWRENDDAPWTSLNAASPWGAERVTWPKTWSVGHDKRGAHDRSFRGTDLGIRWTTKHLELPAQ